jgi:gas vesicle protein
MTERRGFSGSHLLIAAAAGAVLGAAVALLLAPKSGAELRSRIKDLAATSKEAKEAAREAFVTTLERS